MDVILHKKKLQRSFQHFASQAGTFGPCVQVSLKTYSRSIAVTRKTAIIDRWLLKLVTASQLCKKLGSPPVDLCGRTTTPSFGMEESLMNPASIESSSRSGTTSWRLWSFQSDLLYLVLQIDSICCSYLLQFSVCFSNTCNMQNPANKALLNVKVTAHSVSCQSVSPLQRAL